MSEKTKRDQAMSGALIAIVAAVSVVMISMMIVLGSRARDEAFATATPSDFTGVTALEAPQTVPDFTLINQDGEPTSLSDLRGKPTVIFFGFTHCPDVCPTTLGEFRRVHDVVGDQVNFVFISVDGERDTPEALTERFKASETPFMIGLTESVETVLKAGEPFGLVVEADPPDESGNYSVAHTASAFVLNAEGHWVAKYVYGTPAEIMIEDLQGRL